MRPTARPLWRLSVVALLALGAAGSQALRHDAPADPIDESIAPPAPLADAANVELCVVVETAPAAEDPAPEATLPDPRADDTRPAAATDLQTIHRICRVTAYHDRGLTSAGVPSGVGQCAAPADIPLGSRIFIPSLGRTFIVTDRTHRRFRNSTVDIFVPCAERCRQFGRSYREVEITLPERKHTRPELIRTAQRLSRTG